MRTSPVVAVANRHIFWGCHSCGGGVQSQEEFFLDSNQGVRLLLHHFQL